MSATIGKVYVDAVITDERYKECMALVQEANERIDELRELVRDMWLHSYCSIAKTREDDERHIEDVIDRMRKLGVEVDG